MPVGRAAARARGRLLPPGQGLPAGPPLHPRREMAASSRWEADVSWGGGPTVILCLPGRENRLSRPVRWGAERAGVGGRREPDSGRQHGPQRGPCLGKNTSPFATASCSVGLGAWTGCAGGALGLQNPICAWRVCVSQGQSTAAFLGARCLLLLTNVHFNRFLLKQIMLF